MQAFLEVFENVSLPDAVIFIAAMGFIIGVIVYSGKRLIRIYNTIQEKLDLIGNVDDIEKELNAFKQLHASDMVERDRKLHESFSLLNGKIDSITVQLEEMKKSQNDTKVNELRDRLLHAYRYYNSPTTNPTLSWNEMEEQAFWKLFHDYEKRGGDGYMHTVVQPAMSNLRVIKLTIPNPEFEQSKEDTNYDNCPLP